MILNIAWRWAELFVSIIWLLPFLFLGNMSYLLHFLSFFQVTPNQSFNLILTAMKFKVYFHFLYFYIPLVTNICVRLGIVWYLISCLQYLCEFCHVPLYLSILRCTVKTSILKWSLLEVGIFTIIGDNIGQKIIIVWCALVALIEC